MKGMILAAGRGRRMGNLTQNTPKPLLKVGGKTLIEHRIAAFQKAGILEIIINVSYLAQQIVDYLGDGTAFGVNITYSHEEKIPLNTGGGIIRALDFFEGKPFAVTNSDIVFSHPVFNHPPNIASLLNKPRDILGHLVMVANPDYHPTGDFALENNVIKPAGDNRCTFSGLAYYHPDLFKPYAHKKATMPLVNILKPAIAKGCISAEFSNKTWHDVGTPERLAEVQNAFK